MSAHDFLIKSIERCYENGLTEKQAEAVLSSPAYLAKLKQFERDYTSGSFLKKSNSRFSEGNAWAQDRQWQDKLRKPFNHADLKNNPNNPAYVPRAGINPYDVNDVKSKLLRGGVADDPKVPDYYQPGLSPTENSARLSGDRALTHAIPGAMGGLALSALTRGRVKPRFMRRGIKAPIRVKTKLTKGNDALGQYLRGQAPRFKGNTLRNMSTGALAGAGFGGISGARTGYQAGRKAQEAGLIQAFGGSDLTEADIHNMRSDLAMRSSAGDADKRKVEKIHERLPELELKAERLERKKDLSPEERNELQAIVAEINDKKSNLRRLKQDSQLHHKVLRDHQARLEKIRGSARALSDAAEQRRQEAGERGRLGRLWDSFRGKVDSDTLRAPSPAVVSELERLTDQAAGAAYGAERLATSNMSNY